MRATFCRNEVMAENIAHPDSPASPKQWPGLPGCEHTGFGGTRPYVALARTLGTEGDALWDHVLRGDILKGPRWMLKERETGC